MWRMFCTGKKSWFENHTFVLLRSVFVTLIISSGTDVTAQKRSRIVGPAVALPFG